MRLDQLCREHPSARTIINATFQGVDSPAFEDAGALVSLCVSVNAIANACHIEV